LQKPASYTTLELHDLSAMSQHNKLLERLRNKPRDFTWSELEKILDSFGYKQERGSGSRRKFYNEKTNAFLSLHEPHPKKELKAYQIRDVLNHLKQENYI
jgi:predicted RNA binding protein YcfA (HicA-like mRNA interferase family)